MYCTGCVVAVVGRCRRVNAARRTYLLMFVRAPGAMRVHLIDASRDRSKNASAVTRDFRSLPQVRHEPLRTAHPACIYSGLSVHPLMIPLRPFARTLVSCPHYPAVRHFAASARCSMPSNDPKATNASGLTPQESKGLRERQPEPHEEKILQGIKEVCAFPYCLGWTRTHLLYVIAAVHIQTERSKPCPCWLRK